MCDSEGGRARIRVGDCRVNASSGADGTKPWPRLCSTVSVSSRDSLWLVLPGPSPKHPSPGADRWCGLSVAHFADRGQSPEIISLCLQGPRSMFVFFHIPAISWFSLGSELRTETFLSVSAVLTLGGRDTSVPSPKSSLGFHGEVRTGQKAANAEAMLVPHPLVRDIPEVLLLSFGPHSTDGGQGSRSLRQSQKQGHAFTGMWGSRPSWPSGGKLNSPCGVPHSSRTRTDGAQSP